MRTASILMSLLTILLLAACGRVDSSTPTPFSTAAPTVVMASDRIVQARITDLVNNPSAYSGVVVQVSGDYRRLPRLICDTAPHLSPATWSLTAGEVMIQANGYETLLRPVASGSLVLTIEGRWQQWQGLVGCGKEATPREIWYLEVSRILSPNPIVHVTPPRDTTGDEIAILPTPTADDADFDDDDLSPPPPSPPGEVAPPPFDEPTPSPAPTLTPASGAPPIELPTPSLSTPTPVATPGNGITTATATTTATTTTAEPPGTPGSTPTVTATGTVEAPGPPGIPTPVPGEQGNIAPRKIVKVDLATGAVHLWQFQITGSEKFTIGVQPDVALNVSLTVRGPEGELIINNQNAAPAGQAETAIVDLTAVGTYEIIVSSVNGTAGLYAIALFDELADPVAFAGSLAYGDNVAANLPALRDDWWHFSGMAGEVISIRVTPQDNSDPDFFLYGPDMTLLSSVANGAGGEPEELLNFQLPATGFYSILIQEYDYAASNYRISLTRQ